MTKLAKHLCTFLKEYLPCERRASQHTCAAYAYTFQLLLCFVKTSPSQIEIEQLDVKLIVAFLNHLETARSNSARTRNARIAAIKAFFRFLEFRYVYAIELSHQIQLIPLKRTDEKLIDFLTVEEVTVVLSVPDPTTIAGVRDRAMLHLCYGAGLRVSELTELRLEQLSLNSSPTIHVIGKGRRERVLPLWRETADSLKAWITLRTPKEQAPELFLNAQGKAMTRSGFEYILNKHVKAAARLCPSLAKKHISPHSLRHSCAMLTLKATGDIRKVSLWLGHATIKSTEIYLRNCPDEKLEVLLATTPPSIERGRFSPPDKLLAMLHDTK